MSEAKALRKKIAATEGGLDAHLRGEIGDHSPRAVTNMIKLADGGYERVSRTLEPAGLVTVKRPMMKAAREVVGMSESGFPQFAHKLDSDGKPVMEPMFDERGHVVYVEDLLYPDLPPHQLDEVRRSVEVADCDRGANQYLLDQTLGKPRQAVEHSGPDGKPIAISLNALPAEDLNELERIASRLVEVRPEGGLEGDPG